MRTLVKRSRQNHAANGGRSYARAGAWSPSAHHWSGHANRSATVGATRLSIVALPFAQSLRRSGAGYLADALTDN